MVGKGRAQQLLDAGENIAGRITAAAGGAIKVDCDRRRCCLIARRVKARAAVDRVRARAAGDRVIARAALKRIAAQSARQRIVVRAADEHVVAEPAFERVGIRGTDDLFDADEHVARRIAAAARRAGERNGHARTGRGIVGHIIARATVQRIGPAAADQRIIADIADERFVRPRSDQRIRLGRTEHGFDAAQRIAFGIAADACAAAEKHGNALDRGAVIRDVRARGTVQGVRARPAEQGIVARAANLDVIPQPAD